MDAFEVRQHFTNLLKEVGRNRTGLSKAELYLTSHLNHNTDLFNCILEQLTQMDLLSRLNLFYLLDVVSQLELDKNPYLALVEESLVTIAESVVPPTVTGNVNLASFRKVLSSWKNKNLFSTEILDKVDEFLSQRKPAPGPELSFSKHAVIQRIEDDRERHKRLREENWIQPTDPSARTELTELMTDLPSPNLPEFYQLLQLTHAKYLIDTISID